VCNAWNHWDGCTCGFGGEGHLGSGRGGWARTVIVRSSTPTIRETAWANWATGHARSDLGEPLTHPTLCPVCGAEIFFHTNGNGDVVFFDELGKPWPRHPCLTTEDGIRAASRSPSIKAVATLVVRPRFIPLPRSLSPAEFDQEYADKLIHGVVVRMKEAVVWWARDDSVISRRLEVLALGVYVRSKRAVRVFVSKHSKVRVGDIITMHCAVRSLNGRSALWADTVTVVQPDDQQ
jgi:hypothetical protein